MKTWFTKKNFGKGVIVKLQNYDKKSRGKIKPSDFRTVEFMQL